MNRLRLHARATSDGEVKLLDFFDAQRAADGVVREAAALQEAHALGDFLARGRGLAIFALEDRLRLLEIAGRGDAIGYGVGDAVRLEVLADSRRGVLAGKLVRADLGIALVRE